MPVFPDYIEINLQNYSEEYEPNLFVSDFEAGPSKQRRRTTKTVKTITFTGSVCTKANYKAFISWWKDEIRQGSDWFCFTDPCALAEEDAQVRARMNNFSIKGTPVQAISNTGLERWDIDFQIEVWS